MLPDMPDHLVIIIVVTDGYNSFLSVVVWISLPYRFVVCSGWRGVREYREIWNSFTAVPNLTNLIVRADRRILAVTMGRRKSGLSNKDYLTLVHVHTVMGACGGAEDSIPDGVNGIFHCLYPSSRAMDLGSTLPLTEIRTRNISCG
jgi:hypothetical protein